MDSLRDQGFTVVGNIFSHAEVGAIIEGIEAADAKGPGFRVTKDLFAIRGFLREIPSLRPLIFTDGLLTLLARYAGDGYFAVKSIYFDKPGSSNWFVAWHQDLTISVDRKALLEGFGPWTIKEGNFGVQPPLYLLENIYTLRIHLDDTDEGNGALRVIPGSHRQGIILPGTMDLSKERGISCPVDKGGVMIMRPLLMHASGRSASDRPRRVIHIEFSSLPLPAPLEWAERIVRTSSFQNQRSLQDRSHPSQSQ